MEESISPTCKTTIRRQPASRQNCAAYKYAHAHDHPSNNRPPPHTPRKVSRRTGKQKFKGVAGEFINHRLTQPSSNKSFIMGMQSNEGQVVISSIALLQQRFRELERIREKREERLLQVLAARPAAAAAAAPREAPVKWFFHPPDLLYPCRPLHDTAATLFPVAPSTACECKSFQLRGGDTLTVELWSSKTTYKHVSGEVDVDTSLHL